MIKLKTTIQRDRTPVRAGSKLELDGAEEERLVELGHAEYVDSEDDEEHDEHELSPDAQAFAKMNARDAIEFVGTISTLAEVFAFSAVETNRKDGARKTVQEAFVQRVRDLSNPPATT